MKKHAFKVARTGDIRTDGAKILEHLTPAVINFFCSEYGLSQGAASEALGPLLMLESVRHSNIAGVPPEMMRELLDLILTTIEEARPMGRA